MRNIAKISKCVLCFQSLSLPLSSVSKLRHNDDYDDDDDDDDNDDNDDDDDEEEDEVDDLDQIDGEGVEHLDTNGENDDNENINDSIPANSTIVTSVLHLNNVDHSDAGRYQCIVENPFGSTYSHRFKISVACKSLR